jgi:hypothetical protein
VVFERGEPCDRLSPDFESRGAVGDPLLGLGQDIKDRLAQQGQRRALRLLQGIQVLVDLLSRPSPLCWPPVLTGKNAVRSVPEPVRHLLLIHAM